MSNAFDPLLGRVLDGRYEVLAKIARGGMATVYRGRDTRLSRTVAIKVMRTDLGDEDGFAAKFDREARAAALINHPNTVSVFDQGVEEGRPFIVMEYVEGETLRRMISREAPLAPSQALEILEPVASALACAHELGLVHRDIKPENILLSARGGVQVTDFGLARLTTGPQLTATGVLVGTASYLPPELVTHAKPNARSDIYSTGVVLFEMLTGKKPHTGENNYQIAYRHVNVDIEPPSERLRELGYRHHIPDYLDALVAAMTTRDPSARISDGRELLKHIRRARRRLANDPLGDDQALTAKLMPAPGDTTTRPIPVAPRPRPRTPATPATPIGRDENTPPMGIARTQRRGDESPTVALSPAAAHHQDPPTLAMKPVTAQRQDPPTQMQPAVREDGPPQHAPNGARPIPRTSLSLSLNPVHRRRRGIVLLILALAAALVVGVAAYAFTNAILQGAAIILAGAGLRLALPPLGLTGPEDS